MDLVTLTLAQRLEALVTAWTDVHGDEAKDTDGMELYASAYRECIHDVRDVLAGGSTCPHRYEGAANGAVCTLPLHPENPHGHSYQGSSVPDLHDASEAAAERGRG